MTAWITLIALTVLFTLALRPPEQTSPPCPPGTTGNANSPSCGL